MNSINWPEKYQPGTTDNFVSNEVIVAGLTAAEVWPYLSDTTHWPSYYNNASDIVLEDGTRRELADGLKFRFLTFGMQVEAVVTEYVEPIGMAVARLSFRAWIAGTSPEEASAYHAFLIEDLEGGRVRLLTQESQLGEPARQMASMKPNPVLNAHQDWLEGLAQAATSGQ